MAHVNSLAGITKDRVEDMEDRLRQDILNEAADFDDQILVADEDDSFNVFDMMLRVSEADVQTPKSMFTELQAEGYNVVYNRIPITDEKASPHAPATHPMHFSAAACSCRLVLADLLTRSVTACRPPSQQILTTCYNRCTQPATQQHLFSTARWAAAGPRRAWSSPPWRC